MRDCVLSSVSVDLFTVVCVQVRSRRDQGNEC